MFKSIAIYFCTLMFFISFNVNAETCENNYDGMWFYNVSIENDSTTCVYRYCYYNCRYGHYTMKGTFKPVKGPWESYPNRDLCMDEMHSEQCVFEQQS